MADAEHGAEPKAPQIEQERFEKIVAALQAKGVTATCPRCHAQKWGVSEIALLVSEVPVRGLSIPPPNVQVVLVNCMNCGWLAMHETKSLGLEP